MRRRIAAFLMVLLVAGGCPLGEVPGDSGHPVAVASTDVVGSWCHEPTGRIVFAADGTFAASSLPGVLLNSSPPPTGAATPPAPRGPVDGSGTWAMAAPTLSARIELTFLQLVNAGADVQPDRELEASEYDDGEMFIRWHFGDDFNDKWYGFLSC